MGNSKSKLRNRRRSPKSSASSQSTIRPSHVLSEGDKMSNSTMTRDEPSETLNSIMKKAESEKASSSDEESEVEIICSNARNEAIEDNIDEPGKIFHRFPDLPKELRLQIWRLAGASRIIKFQPQSSMATPYEHMCFSIQAPKVISSTCREAQEVLLTYNLQIQSRDQRYSKKVLVDSEADILYLKINDPTTISSAVTLLWSMVKEINHGIGAYPTTLSSIKHIALPWTFVNDRYAQPLIQLFPNLETLTLFLPIRQDLWNQAPRFDMLPALAPVEAEVGDLLNKIKSLKKAFKNKAKTIPKIEIKWIFDPDEK